MTPILFYGHGLDSVWLWRKDDLSMARKKIAHEKSTSSYHTGIPGVNGDVTKWEIEKRLNVTKYAPHSNLTLKNRRLELAHASRVTAAPRFQRHPHRRLEETVAGVGRVHPLRIYYQLPTINLTKMVYLRPLPFVFRFDDQVTCGMPSTISIAAVSKSESPSSL